MLLNQNVSLNINTLSLWHKDVFDYRNISQVIISVSSSQKTDKEERNWNEIKIIIPQLSIGRKTPFIQELICYSYVRFA